MGILRRILALLAVAGSAEAGSPSEVLPDEDVAPAPSLPTEAGPVDQAIDLGIRLDQDTDPDTLSAGQQAVLRAWMEHEGSSPGEQGVSCWDLGFHEHLQPWAPELRFFQARGTRPGGHSSYSTSWYLLHAGHVLPVRLYEGRVLVRLADGEDVEVGPLLASGFLERAVGESLEDQVVELATLLGKLPGGRTWVEVIRDASEGVQGGGGGPIRSLQVSRDGERVSAEGALVAGQPTLESSAVFSLDVAPRALSFECTTTASRPLMVY